MITRSQNFDEVYKNLDIKDRQLIEERKIYNKDILNDLRLNHPIIATAFSLKLMNNLPYEYVLENLIIYLVKENEQLKNDLIDLNQRRKV